MQLATISDPTNVSLYTGAAILQSIGFSPLLLTSLGLLSRVSDSIGKKHRILVDSRVLRLIQLVITVALILGIIGGVNAGNNVAKTGRYQVGSLSKASTALFIVSFVAVAAATIIVSASVSHAEPGEKRLAVAVALSLPLLLVRLIYGCLSNFSHDKTFNQLDGSPTAILCMAVIEEFIIVSLYMGTGLTLRKLDRTGQEPPEGAYTSDQIRNDTSGETPLQARSQQTPRKENPVLKIAKMTIIGRIITSLMGSGNRERDYEMQQQYVQK